MKKTAEEKWIIARTNAISFMLDNPNSIGIFPTSECFKKLDEAVKQFAAQEVAEATTKSYSEIDMRRAWNNGMDFQRAEAYEDRTGEDHNSPNFNKWILTYQKQAVPQPSTPKDKEETK